jgi:hypothetical protein
MENLRQEEDLLTISGEEQRVAMREEGARA